MVELTAPEEPGEYELRYVLKESDRELVSRPILVLPAEERPGAVAACRRVLVASGSA